MVSYIQFMNTRYNKGSIQEALNMKMWHRIGNETAGKDEAVE